MRNKDELKMGCYTAFMVNLNEYLTVLPVGNENYKISDMELNEIILNSMTNGRSKQSCVKGFNCKTITFNKYVNMFEYM